MSYWSTSNITPITEEHTKAHIDANSSPDTSENEMKTILAAITLALFAVAAFADTDIDTKVSPGGSYDNQAEGQPSNSDEDC